MLAAGGVEVKGEAIMTTEDYGLARRMWHQLEPVHAGFWYAQEVFAEAAALGYDVSTRWPSYFAWRRAPRGAAGPPRGAPRRSPRRPVHGGGATAGAPRGAPTH